MTIAEYEEIKYQARTLGLNDEQIKQLSSNLPDAIFRALAEANGESVIEDGGVVAFADHVRP